LDDFGTEGVPNPAIWITGNADNNDRSDAPPSPPFAMNLNGNPDGGDTVTLQPIDLSSMAGTGVVLSYYYQPEGNGNSPETGDSLKLSFMNDLGDWVSVREYPGVTLHPFTLEIVDIESQNAGGGTFLHSQFQLRFTSKGALGAIPNDDWFIDNLFLGVPAPAAGASPNPLLFDTTMVGGSTTLPLNILNLGLEDLVVTDIVSGNPAVFGVEPTSFTVVPGGLFEVDVTFTPGSPGTIEGALKVASNDPDDDSLTVVLSGISVVPTSVTEGSGLPSEFGVSPNYPNPFNPSTTIKYQLPEAGHVELIVYSLLGDEVTRLVSEEMEAGYHESVWNGKNSSGVPVTSGVYLYRFRAGDYLMVRKMLLLK
ncbi:MAG: T9SS type A sorting domain-containing protein, partial [Ignavibacteria bacterium]|nr:T9SS type A sorting domain-containing protein [Ignavibacteria bacterium]